MKKTNILAEEYEAPRFETVSVSESRVLCASTLNGQTEDLDDLNDYEW